LLAGCGGSQPPISAPLNSSAARLTKERAHTRHAYSVIYSFRGYPGDGADPGAGLTNVNDTLYGTTEYGCENYNGAIFAITTSGKETVLHCFAAKPDGAVPQAGLLNVSGTLYGTTNAGGAYGAGTVFAITPSGHETVLYSFYNDGFHPLAGLIKVKGTLYGTTEYGCRSGGGTVFAITTSGKKTVLHCFAAEPDGASPYAGLLDVNGTLYGTTWAGGASGYGTVFSITTSGKETVLHSFGTNAGDGESPWASLINVKGTLYGTAGGGGANGDGTVFAITTSGKETVLYSFKGRPDGAKPYAGLLNVNGTFYGTTNAGGAYCRKHRGCGTIFSISPSGAETVLYSFHAADGESPDAALLNINGTLYGTTSGGGANQHGTVFAFKP